MMHNRIFSLKNSIAVVVLLAIVIFFLRAIVPYRAAFFAAVSQLPIAVVGVSVVFFLLYFYCRVWSWQLMLAMYHRALPYKKACSVWFFGESARYIPGNIWSSASRVYLAQQVGVPKKETARSVVIEIIALIAIPLVWSLPVADRLIDAIAVKTLVGVGVAALVIGAVAIIILRKQFLHEYEMFQKMIVEKPRLAPTLGAVLTQAIAWGAFGISFWLLVRQFAPHANALAIISIAICSWLIGYLSLLTPMGLGVREGILVVLLHPYLSFAEATAVAVVSRCLMTIAEGGNVCVWLFMKQKERL